MIGLGVYVDSDEESDKSPAPSSSSFSSTIFSSSSASSSVQPSVSSSSSSSSPSEVTNNTTITVNTSVTVVVRKTIQRQSTTNSLISYGSDSEEEGEERRQGRRDPHLSAFADGVIDIISSPKPPKTNSSKHTSSLRLMRLLPPEPLGHVDKEIQEKISNYLKMGKNYNTMLQGMKNFHNPYILNKIAEKYLINQTASNYPPELYDPQEWEREDYERIARRQEHVLKERAQQEEIKFVAPAAPVLTSSSSANAPGLRRWDTGQPASKKMKSTPAVQHALQVANHLKASLSSGAIDAAATAKKEATARAALATKKP